MNYAYIKLKGSILAIVLTLGAGMLFSLKANAQEKNELSNESEKGGHKITIGIGQAHIHENFVEKGQEWMMASSLALNYDYLITDRWSIGLHNDLILDDFSIEKREGGAPVRAIERKRPLASKLVGSYSPLKRFHVSVGAGAEIEESENFFLSTIGGGYEFSAGKGWGFGVDLAYDVKWKAYDTWIIGFGISKTILPKKR